jgi:hypothetical protein
MAFHTQVFRQCSTGRAPFLDSVVILCTSGIQRAAIGYPQKKPGLALISSIKKL